MLSDKKNVHFVGIGGIGMSGIARIMLERGYKVSGSDLELNSITENLEKMGATIFEGHRASNLPRDVELIVYSSSVSTENPELVEARRRRLEIIHRAAALGMVFNKKKGIAITGTHGKTTTTSLIALMLENAGLDPTAIIGGEVSAFNGNAKLGGSQYIVAEADESDASFLSLKPYYAVVTNLEMEHMDHYEALDDVIRAYRAFLEKVKNGGVIFYNRDDRNLRKMLKSFKGRARSFGFSSAADAYPVDVKMNGFHTSFSVMYKSKRLGRMSLNIPGRHNVLNALAALLVGLELGLDFEEIARSMRDFEGAKRRFQLRTSSDGVMLIDDYAHHPTEIRAVLDACRNWRRKRIVVVFQPHRYTRTKFLAEDFGRCFKGADKLILTDIYPASESPIEGVSIESIYDRVKRNGPHDCVVMKKDSIAEYVMRMKRRGDMVLVLGAGDIKKVADEIAQEFRKKLEMKEEGLAGELKKTISGRVVRKERLSRHTSFRIGGPADIWVEPADAADLKNILLFAKKRKIPLFIIGNGTNVLAGDNGFRGIVVKLASPFFKKIEIKKNHVTVGSGFSLPQLARISCEKGLGGMESLVGIPGTIGGAIFMNAGGYDNPIYKNIGNLVSSLKVMDRSGRIKNLKRRELKFRYRSSNLKPYIILEAVLKLKRDDSQALIAASARFLRIKREKQVLDAPSAGCVFKNLQGSQFTCGQMIDMLGLKGRRVGGAEISTKHANFIINRDKATSNDVLSLLSIIKDKVRHNYGIDLELEIKVI